MPKFSLLVLVGKDQPLWRQAIITEKHFSADIYLGLLSLYKIMVLRRTLLKKFQMTAQFSRLMIVVLGRNLEMRSKTETS